MAQELLRPMPSLLSYHTNRAVAQADVNGGWSQRPRAWRFVVLRFTPGETLAFSPEQNEMVAQDHVNCLYRLRSCDVEETVLLDRLGGQMALAKFMLEADRPAAVDPEQAWSAFTELADRVPRRWTARSALGRCSSTACSTRSSASRSTWRVSGRSASSTRRTRVGYIEAYFDHRRWGEEALGVLSRDGALGRVRDLVDVNLLRVEEQAPLDVR